MQPKVPELALNVPMQVSLCGAKYTKPVTGCATAPSNFSVPPETVGTLRLMSMQSNVFEFTSNVPTQSALEGAKTTKPLSGCVAAPSNFFSSSVILMSMQENVSEITSNVPTQSALYGAKTTRLLSKCAAAPLKRFLLRPSCVSMQLKVR